MNRLGWLCWSALLLGVVVGCGSGTSKSAADPNYPENPAAQAAYDFLDAVIEGDSQRASGRLSPLAMQRIVESGKQFSPPGLETASFRIGETRLPTSYQALVQCILTDKSLPNDPHEEEICCLMRLVDNQWCVSGIAYSAGPSRPPMILDFENPQAGPTPAQPMAGSDSPASPSLDRRPSPQRTAQEPTYSPAR